MILSPFKKNGHPVRGTRYSSVLLTAPMIYLCHSRAGGNPENLARLLATTGFLPARD